MVAVVSAETVLLVLLLVLVAGLLRSHAEILKRLSAAEDDVAAGGQVGRVAVDGGTGLTAAGDPAQELAGPEATPRRSVDQVPPALSGVTPAGDAVALALQAPATRPTLLAFLTSGCTSCAGFWDTLGERRLPPGIDILIVTHGSDRESPGRLRKLAPNQIPVLMSSQAWTDYGVPGSPYFVLVDGFIRGEGVATSWSALASLVGDAIEDERAAGGSGERRTQDVDATLAAAGIGPGHASLYPGRHPTNP